MLREIMDGIDSGKIGRLRALQSATEVEEFLDDEALDWEPLGGTDNVGVVRSGSSPAQALTERLTNGIDAVVERAAEEDKFDTRPSSPRDAINQLFDLGDGRFNGLSSGEVREIAEQSLLLVMGPGSSDDELTIEVRDSGVGQAPEDFHDTFFGLDKNSKINKPYLIGKYGQGGSNTFDFCNYAIIISRRFDGGDVGWSIVRFNPRLDEEEEYSDGIFEYCTRPNGTIPSVDESEAGDWTGSIVRLIDYDSADFNNALGPSTNSIYTIAHRTMFGSIYPFILRDTRTEQFSYRGSPRNRTVVGSRYRLDQPAKDVGRKREFQTVNVGDDLGTLKLKYWVFDDSSGVDQFVDKTRPIVFTLHGQTHHSEPKRHLKNIGYSILKDRIIVEVECDGLNQKGKRIFSSTRDRASKGEEYRRIKKKILDSLQDDTLLEELEQEYKKKLLDESSSEEEEKAKKLLADLLQQSSEEEGDGPEGPGGDDGPDGKPDDTKRKGRPPMEPVEPLHEYPTFVEIANTADPIKARRGRTMRVRVKTDAEDDFERMGRGSFSLDWGSELDGALELRNATSLENGWKVFQIEVDEDAELGIEDSITVCATWDDGEEADTKQVRVVRPPAKPSKKGRTQPDAPEIKRVESDDAGRRESLGWQEDDAVVEYISDDDTNTVFVALFNENIQEIREINDTEGTIRQHDRQYAAYISYYEIMRQQEVEESDDEGPSEEYLTAEKNRIAKVLMRSISEGLSPAELGIV